MLKYIKRTVSTTHIDSEKDIVAPLLNDIVCRVTANSCKPGAKTIGPTGRAYNADWEKKYGWLLYENGRMFCKICVAAKKDNRFAKDGAGTFENNTLLFIIFISR
jgi:hypothetical protein